MELSKIAIERGAEHTVRYLNGYQPVHRFVFTDWSVEVTVFGDYDAWDPVPPSVSDLIAWGKPDLVAFDRERQRVLFAVEESAATPTGNQATQRCERQFGAAKAGIPFWYLLSEFGRHIDGNVRRDSIWPTVMALKITQDRKLPSIVLHYSDLQNPEDYSAGSGLNALFSGLLLAIENAAKDRPLLWNLDESLTEQYENMLKFLGRQWRNQIDFLPGERALHNQNLATNYAKTAVGSDAAGQVLWDINFLRWPKTEILPKANRDSQRTRPLIKHDHLAAQMENDVTRGLAYGLSGRSGSRPQPEAQVAKWIEQQRVAFSAAPSLQPPAEFSIQLNDFPRSESGLRHLTTSRRITFLYDRWEDFERSVGEVFPRLLGKLPDFNPAAGVFVYVSNSIKPGRIFGDPFTGQIAAYATAFGKWDQDPRMVVTYFPHQSHSQAIAGAQREKNKGLTIIREMVDVAIFAGGVAYLPKSGDVL